jgi:hypothetical protein
VPDAPDAPGRRGSRTVNDAPPSGARPPAVIVPPRRVVSRCAMAGPGPLPTARTPRYRSVSAPRSKATATPSSVRPGPPSRTCTTAPPPPSGRRARTSGRPAGYTDRRAYDLISDGFGPGTNGQFTIVADLGGTPPGTGTTALAASLHDALATTPGVARASAAAPSDDGTLLVDRLETRLTDRTRARYPLGLRVTKADVTGTGLAITLDGGPSTLPVRKTEKEP